MRWNSGIAQGRNLSHSLARAEVQETNPLSSPSYKPPPSACGFPIHRNGMSAARRPANPTTQTLRIQLQLGNGAAEGVTVHSQLACCLALVSLAVLQYGENKSFFELTNAFRISYAVLVHLQDQSFQLIFHDASLFCFIKGHKN